MELLGEQGVDFLKVKSGKTAAPPHRNKNGGRGSCSEPLQGPPGFSRGDSAHAQRHGGREAPAGTARCTPRPLGSAGHTICPRRGARGGPVSTVGTAHPFPRPWASCKRAPPPGHRTRPCGPVALCAWPPPGPGPLPRTRVQRAAPTRPPHSPRSSPRSGHSRSPDSVLQEGTATLCCPGNAALSFRGGLSVGASLAPLPPLPPRSSSRAFMGPCNMSAASSHSPAAGN